MSSFKDLLAIVSTITEAKVSPYAGSHPSFGGITSKMKAGGLSSAPLDTIKFIRETLYFLDILDDNELATIKRAPGFSGKKQAMLATLKAKQDVINARSTEIAERINDTLDDFINGAGVNRGREEKYAAQAAAEEIAKQMRQAKSGKQMDDVLTDIISDETLLVKASVAKILAELHLNLGTPGFDIPEEALNEVQSYAGRIDTVEKLKSFVRQISNEPGYEKIAAYLSSAIKPLSTGTEDEEMIEDEEDSDIGPEEYYEDPNVSDEDREEARKPWPTSDEDGDDESEKKDETIKESGVSIYMTEQIKRDSVRKCAAPVESSAPKLQSFNERYKPKTMWQLEELSRYGL